MAYKYLRRYTDIPSLLRILKEKKLSLVNPKLWDDINDSYFLLRYKERMKYAAVLALCFSQSSEAYHYWRVFANGPSGIWILFKRKSLVTSLKSINDIRFGRVKYRTLKDIREKKPTLDELPFVKRRAFKDEKEYRIIYESRNNNIDSYDFNISLSSIDKILLSPWLHRNLSKTISHIIKSIDDCGHLKVRRSTLVNNEEWRKIGSSVN
jgi:hypothetical protein